MSLDQQLAEERALFLKKKENEKIETARQSIRDLEKKINQLTILKGSLEQRSDGNVKIDTMGRLRVPAEPGAGLGMTDYLSARKENFENEEVKLEKVREDNKDLLKAKKLVEKEKFLYSKKYGDTSQAQNYKRVRRRLEEVTGTPAGEVRGGEGALHGSDQILEARLKELKVTLPKGTFSYKKAAKAIEGNLNTLNRFMLIEKAKVPEYKEEAEAVFAKEAEAEQKEKERRQKERDEMAATARKKLEQKRDKEKAAREKKEANKRKATLEKITKQIGEGIPNAVFKEAQTPYGVVSTLSLGELHIVVDSGSHTEARIENWEAAQLLPAGLEKLKENAGSEELFNKALKLAYEKKIKAALSTYLGKKKGVLTFEAVRIQSEKALEKNREVRQEYKKFLELSSTIYEELQEKMMQYRPLTKKKSTAVTLYLDSVPNGEALKGLIFDILKESSNKQFQKNLLEANPLGQIADPAHAVSEVTAKRIKDKIEMLLQLRTKITEAESDTAVLTALAEALVEDDKNGFSTPVEHYEPVDLEAEFKSLLLEKTLSAIDAQERREELFAGNDLHDELISKINEEKEIEAKAKLQTLGGVANEQEIKELMAADQAYGMKIFGDPDYEKKMKEFSAQTTEKLNKIMKPETEVGTPSGVGPRGKNAPFSLAAQADSYKEALILAEFAKNNKEAYEAYLEKDPAATQKFKQFHDTFSSPEADEKLRQFVGAAAQASGIPSAPRSRADEILALKKEIDLRAGLRQEMLEDGELAVSDRLSTRKSVLTDLRSILKRGHDHKAREEAIAAAAAEDEHDATLLQGEKKKKKTQSILISKNKILKKWALAEAIRNQDKEMLERAVNDEVIRENNLRKIVRNGLPKERAETDLKIKNTTEHLREISKITTNDEFKDQYRFKMGGGEPAYDELDREYPTVEAKKSYMEDQLNGMLEKFEGKKRFYNQIETETPKVIALKDAERRKALEKLLADYNHSELNVAFGKNRQSLMEIVDERIGDLGKQEELFSEMSFAAETAALSLKQNPSSELRDLIRKDRIRLDQESKAAENLRKELKPIFDALPADQTLRFENGKIIFLSKENELKKKYGKDPEKDYTAQMNAFMETAVKNADDDTSTIKKNPVTFLRRKLHVFQQKKDMPVRTVRKVDIEEAIAAYEKLKNETYISLPQPELESLRELVSGEGMKGTPAEIFKSLDDELAKIVNRKTPDSVIKIYEGYRSLENKLAFGQFVDAGPFTGANQNYEPDVRTKPAKTAEEIREEIRQAMLEEHEKKLVVQKKETHVSEGELWREMSQIYESLREEMEMVLARVGGSVSIENFRAPIYGSAITGSAKLDAGLFGGKPNIKFEMVSRNGRFVFSKMPEIEANWRIRGILIEAINRIPQKLQEAFERKYGHIKPTIEKGGITLDFS